ncbi:NUDIX domain-containing protein [Streptomyces sp. NPDC006624]|uniref:NUDIX hydrolase n=1 Tax=Streptomyces sp. NPDC006624 TaxID=3154892 RepID=UPI0033A6557D
MVVKESTASVFVFNRGQKGVWRCALVWHPRLEEWLPAGGHVESDESAAEAAVREVDEETGLTALLLPGPALPLPAGFPHTQVIAPWYVCEMRAGADNHTRAPHRHVDHVFVAVVDDTTPSRQPVHEVRWFTEQELAEAPSIAEDSRLQAKELFGRIDDVVGANCI